MAEFRKINQPEWKLLSYFNPGILVITKLESAVLA
jgi:hypothetical protein